MQLQDILYTQGFGTRRVCAGLSQQGFVTVDGVPITDPGTDLPVTDGLRFTVQGTAWEYHDKAYVLLHKPAGTECSQKPSTWPRRRVGSRCSPICPEASAPAFPAQRRDRCG